MSCVSLLLCSGALISVLPTINGATPGFSLTFIHSRTAADLEVIVEVAADLDPTSWHDLLLSPAPAAYGSLTTIDDSCPDVRGQRFTATPGSTRMFYRLKVR